MEVRCKWCTKLGMICDEVTEWALTKDGAYQCAPQIESCPEFEMDPEYMDEALVKLITEADYDDQFQEVRVHAQPSGRYDIGILTKINFNWQDAAHKVKELTEHLNEANRTELGILDATFKISFMFPSVDGDGPDAVDVNGQPIRIAPVEPIETDFQKQMDQMAEDYREYGKCSICGGIKDAEGCTSCGYKEEE